MLKSNLKFVYFQMRRNREFYSFMKVSSFNNSLLAFRHCGIRSYYLLDSPPLVCLRWLHAVHFTLLVLHRCGFDVWPTVWARGSVEMVKVVGVWFRGRRFLCVPLAGE